MKQRACITAWHRVASLWVLILVVTGTGCTGRGSDPAPEVDSTSSAILTDALTALRNGDYVRAMALAQAADSRQPGLTETHYVKGQIYFDLRFLDQAEAHWSRTRDAEPEYWLWYHNLGDVAFRQTRFAEAVRNYRRAAELDPNPVSLHGLASAFWEQGMSDSTAAALERAVAVDPTYAPVYVTLSAYAEEEGRLEDAAAYAHRAVSLDSLNAGHHLAAGVLDYKLGLYDEAMAHLGRVLAVESGNATALYNYGMALQQTGQQAEAQQFLEAAEQARDQERQIELLRNAVANNPTNPGNHRALARTLHAVGQIDEALREYKAADLLAPGDLRLQHTIATLHLESGDFGEAEWRYRAIISVDSTFVEAWLNLGLVHARRDSMRAARQVWREAATRFPSNASVREVMERMNGAGD